MLETTAVMALEAKTLDVAAIRATVLARLREWHETQAAFVREFAEKYGVSAADVLASVTEDSADFPTKQKWERQQALRSNRTKRAAECFFPSIAEEVRAGSAAASQRANSFGNNKESSSEN